MEERGPGLLPAWIRHTSLATCVVFVYVNVVHAAVEPAMGFWKERKEAVRRLSDAGQAQAPAPTEKIIRRITRWTRLTGRVPRQ